jgi:5-methylcytosine-specific restriction enzyme subunit McrC
VSLREWETLRPEHGTVLADRTLADCAAGRQLAEQLTSSGRIEVLELVRGLELRATSFVGRFSLGEITVTVQPKISGAPLLNLLRYAYGLRHLSLYEPTGYAVAESTFQDLLIRQLAAETAELLARGVHRDYERRNADLATPRGRINFNRYVRVAHRAQAVLPCVEYPRVEDTPLNQVLLGGLRFAVHMTADVELRARLNRLAKVLDPTVSMKRLDGAALVAAWRIMDRRTTAYEPALIVIEMLLRGQGVALDGEVAPVRLPGFLFDMNRFFQALLSRFLRENLEGCEVEDECRLAGLFRYDPARNPRRRQPPVQKPDFVVRRERRVVALLDAKYRDLWALPLPREMLYQLALYALGQSGTKRQAAILYPTMDAAAREQAIIVQEPVGGAPQAEVILRPVNLLTLNGLLRDRAPQAGRQRCIFAAQLAFGETPAAGGACQLRRGLLV